MNTKILSKYFQEKQTLDLVYHNGGLIPAHYGEIIGDKFGCGLTQEEFLLMLYFYGGFSILAMKDHEEAEQMIEEIGHALIANYELDEEQKKWVEEKLINRTEPIGDKQEQNAVVL